MSNLATEHVTTKDGLKLMGFHYAVDNHDVCILLVHGMAGNFIENDFGKILGEEISNSGLGFIYAHNRGYSLINDIGTTEPNETGGFKTRRIGAAYERFEESLLDLDAWMEKVRSLGYKKIILAGHSLGANKIIHYVFKRRPSLLGMILLSPPDMVGNAKEAGKSKVYTKLLTEAKTNMDSGRTNELLSSQLWNYYPISSQTFLDICVDDCPADNLPIMRNPEHFPELASVEAPFLAVVGQFDDIVINSLEEDLKVLQNKATTAKSFTPEIIPLANHSYENQEKTLAEVILRWVKTL